MFYFDFYAEMIINELVMSIY